jgi:hypothetical protein
VAIVYAARDEHLKRDVAVKVIADRIARDPLLCLVSDALADPSDRGAGESLLAYVVDQCVNPGFFATPAPEDLGAACDLRDEL